MAPKEPCAKYEYIVTSQGPKIVPVLDTASKDEESPGDYNVGGYLPIKVSDSFKDGRYIVVRKLGWGHFSTVWLVKDSQDCRHFALKVVKSASRYAETARDEVKLLSQVAEAQPLHPGRLHIVSFIDSFIHQELEDSHVCIVFEPLGENLLALIERNKKKGVPPPIVKAIAKQVLLGLQYLHDECDLVHTDIKPENILISIPDIESHIHNELSESPSPTSRRVGVPLPTKSRSGVSIHHHRRGSGRERHVQIFDSQPLASPSPKSTGLSLSSSSASLQVQLAKIALADHSPSINPFFRDAPTHQKDNATPPIAPTVSNISSDSSSSVSDAGTGDSLFSSPSMSSPATSIGSADLPLSTKAPSCPLVQELLKARFEREKETTYDTQIISPSPLPLRVQTTSDPTVSPVNAGPSLLTQTAPREEDHSTHPTLTSRSSSSSLTPGAPSTLIEPPIHIKIADLGNATPTKRHYTEEIQTQQYRAPEAILGRKDWDDRVDVWSVACVVFELLTAEYLFDPQGQGQLFTRDDDHMAQIIELLGDFPLEAKLGGRYSREIFDHTGALRYIKTLKPWPLDRVMIEKYLFSKADANALCAFLKPMLAPDPRDRKHARDLVNHEWLHIKDEEWVGVDEW